MARTDLRELPVERVPHRHLMERCWELRANVTTYDAFYVALAEALGAPLVTADRKLANAAGVRCDIDVWSSHRRDADIHPRRDRAHPS